MYFAQCLECFHGRIDTVLPACNKTCSALRQRQLPVQHINKHMSRGKNVLGWSFDLTSKFLAKNPEPNYPEINVRLRAKAIVVSSRRNQKFAMN